MSQSEFKVLILEDDPDSVERLRKEMVRGGLRFTHLWVTDGDSFFQALDVFQPDLILSDFALPDYDGFSALALVRQRFPDVPFILVTGAMEEEWVVDSLRMGATDYVLKSRLFRLVPAIRRALTERVVRQEYVALRGALSTSESLFRTVAESAPVGIFRVNARGDSLYVNAMGCQITGLDQEQAPGIGWMERLHPDDRPRVVEVLEASINQGRSCSLEHRFLHADGKIVWVQLQLSPERTGSGALDSFIGFLIDISARKEAEEQARRVSRIHAVLSQTNQMIVRVKEKKRLFDEICRIAVENGRIDWVWVALANPENGEVQIAAQANARKAPVQSFPVSLDPTSPLSCGLTGGALRDGECQQMDDFLSVEEVEPWRGLIAALGLRSGASFPIRCHGVVVAALTLYSEEPRFFTADMVALLTEMALDLSFALDALTTEEERRATEARLNRVLQATNDGFWEWEIKSGKVLFSARWSEILGYRADEIPPRIQAWNVLIHPADYPVVRQAVLDHFSGMTEQFRMDMRLRHRSGTWCWIHNRGRVVQRDEQGAPLLMAGSHFDISAQKKVESELLLHGERLAALLRLSEQSFRSERELIRQALDEAVRLTGSRIGYFHFVNEDQESVELVTWSSATLANCQAVYDHHYPLSAAGVWADSVRLKKTVVHNDYPTQSGCTGLPEGHVPLSRHMSVPILEGEKVHGVMGVGNKETPYEESDGHFLHLFAVDLWRLLQRQRVQNRLLLSEEKFRGLVETTADWIWEIDDTGRYTYASPRIKTLLGYDPQEILGKTPFDLMRADEVERTSAIFQKIVQERRPFYLFENNDQHKDGRTVIMETSGIPMFDREGGYQGFRGVGREITRRKQAESSLHESEEIFRAISASARDAIILIDDQDRILFWNRMAEQTFGYSAREAIGKALHPLLAPARLLLAYESGFATFSTTGQGAAIGKVLELPAIHKSGEELTIELSLAAIELKGKWCAIGFVRDIAERKRIQEREQYYAFQSGVAETGTTLLHNIGNAIMSISYRAERLQERSRKLLESGEILANMGHVVKKRLAWGHSEEVILKELIAALEDTGQGFLKFSHEDIQQNAAKIQTGVEHIAGIIKIHQDSANPVMLRTEFNMQQMVEDAIAIQADLLEKYRVQTEVEIDEKVGRVTLPRSQMLQLMINLIKNSREAIAEQNRVDSREGRITISVRRITPGRIEVWVVDNGCGIAQENLKNIFTYGFTTKERSTGFGLHSASTFVQSLGGEISAQSEGSGRGCSLVIRLPASSDLNLILPRHGRE